MSFRIFIIVFLLNAAFCDKDDYIMKIYKASVPRSQWSIVYNEVLTRELRLLSTRPIADELLEITFQASSETLKSLQNASVAYKVAVEDISQVLNAPSAKGRLKFKDSFGLSERPTYKEIVNVLKRLSKSSSILKKMSVVSIGKSFQNQTIKMFKIEYPGVNDIMVVDAGIHSREWLSILTAVYLAATLSITDSFDKINWFIIPCINPDGYTYTLEKDKLHRKNMNFNDCPDHCRNCGVDLNRNFKYKYGVSGSSKDPCAEIYSGTGPFSEPESKMLAALLDKYAERIKVYLSLHSFGPLILYPWGYANKPVDDWRELRAAGMVAAKEIHKRCRSCTRFQVLSSGKDLYPAAGGSDDYAKSLGIKYSYTMELQGGGETGFDPTPRMARRYAKLNYYGIVAMAEHIVEVDNKSAPLEGHSLGTHVNITLSQVLFCVSLCCFIINILILF